KAAGGARGAVLTRRGITLRVLLRDGLLEPARGVLSIYYLGKKFVGDLGADGTITWQETGQVFNSPSAWATHCKRLVNPAKKSGCGWASVRYKGQKLDQYKAAWLRKHQPNAPPAEEVGRDSPPSGTLGCPPVRVVGWVPALCCPQSLASEGEEEEMPEEEEEEATREGRAPVPEPAATKKLEEKSKKQQCKSLAEPAGTGKVARGSPGDPGLPGSGDGALCFADHGPPGKRLESKPRVPVRYCTLGTRDSARNPQTLVEVTSFTAINKFQPFNVAISSNVLLLLDFHSHLTRSEVVGYLGGRWDTNTQ
ncbi:MPN domain-containing protein, partial [Eudyptes filholi]